MLVFEVVNLVAAVSLVVDVVDIVSVSEHLLWL